jgi:hypothetical protein
VKGIGSSPFVAEVQAGECAYLDSDLTGLRSRAVPTMH